MSLTSSLKSVFEIRIIRIAFLSIAVVTWIIGSSSALSMEKFEDVTMEVGLADMANVISDRSAVWADYDNDGDLDLLSGGKLLRNPGNANHWLKIKLIGNTNTGGRSAFGSQVRIQLENQVLTRQVESGVGLGNQNDITIHFGLGKHEGPVDIEIRWINGARQIVRTDVDRLVTVLAKP